MLDKIKKSASNAYIINFINERIMDKLPKNMEESDIAVQLVKLQEGMKKHRRLLLVWKKKAEKREREDGNHVYTLENGLTFSEADLDNSECEIKQIDEFFNSLRYRAFLKENIRDIKNKH